MKYVLRFHRHDDTLLIESFQPQEHWLPPRPNFDDLAPYKDPVNIFIDSVMVEIDILISQFPEDDRRQIHDNTHLPDAEKSILRVMGAQNCACCNTLKRDELMLISR
jgi:hypothetical protein